MLLLLAAVVTPRPTPPIRRTCCWLSLLGCSREWCPGSVRVRFRNLPFRHPALPSLSSAGARTEDESGSTSSPVGPWCAVCGGGRYRPASRSAHPGGRGAQIATTCTAPRCPPEGYGGSSRMLDLSPPSVGAKWVCVMCYPPRPTGRGGADDGFDGTRGVPWNRLARHPGVIKTFLRAPHWVQHPRSPRANPNLTTYSVRRVTAFHRLLPQGREKWGNGEMGS